MRMISQIEYINKEKKIFKEASKYFVWKSTVTEVKNSLVGLNSRFYQWEGRISELKERSVEIVQSEE